MIYEIAGICFTNQTGLTFGHDPRMVVLSFLIAFLGSFGALEMLDRARGAESSAEGTAERSAERSRARFWLIGASVALGAGIWAMHFVGILAITVPHPLDFAPFSTFLSLAVVVVASAMGIKLSCVKRPTWTHFTAGGTVIGVGITAMHYIGMAALSLEGPIAYHPWPWLLSAIIAIVAATASLMLGNGRPRKWKCLGGACVLTGGICGMHYTGMYSAVALFAENVALPINLSRELLAAALVGATTALLLLELVLAAADRRESQLSAAVSRAEAATRLARQAESRLAAAIEAIPNGFILLDADDRVVMCNGHYRDIYNFNPALVVPGVPFEILITTLVQRGHFDLGGSDPETWIADRMAPHRDCNGTSVYKHLTDGRCVQVREKRTSDGDIVGVLVDVTEARNREAAERERQKLAALGQLAGGVAHEINNLLQPLMTLPEVVLDRLPAEDQESCEDLECMRQAASKIREIVRNILLYARKEEPQLTEFDIVAELRSAIRFVGDLIPPFVDLHAVDLDAQGCCYAAANKTQLTQVVTNLVVNAAQAMNGAGTVTVSTAMPLVTAEQAEELGIEAGRDYLAITVADTGPGMDEATRRRVFEPFFTTKPPGQGTGLGLSVADGILRSWHGAITVQSALGKGTTFVLYVPLSRSTDPRSPETNSRDAANAQRVLSITRAGADRTLVDASA